MPSPVRGSAAYTMGSLPQTGPFNLRSGDWCAGSAQVPAVLVRLCNRLSCRAVVCPKPFSAVTLDVSMGRESAQSSLVPMCPCAFSCSLTENVLDLVGRVSPALEFSEEHFCPQGQRQKV